MKRLVIDGNILFVSHLVRISKEKEGIISLSFSDKRVITVPASNRENLVHFLTNTNLELELTTE